MGNINNILVIDQELGSAEADPWTGEVPHQQPSPERDVCSACGTDVSGYREWGHCPQCGAL